MDAAIQGGNRGLGWSLSFPGATVTVTVVLNGQGVPRGFLALDRLLCS